MAARSGAKTPVHHHRGEAEGTIPFRVRIGVTGHRRLQEEPRIRAGVAEQLRQVCAAFPPSASTPVCFTILTALAEGADRLVVDVARIALAAHAVEIEAVLPLGVLDYLEDFTDENSRREFTRLFDEADIRVELGQAERQTGEHRVAAYVRAGHHIVDRSDLLIAVWDEQAGHGPGGTADVIGYARAAGVPLLIVPAGHDRPSSLPPETLRTAARYRATAEARKRIEEYNELPVGAVPRRAAAGSPHLLPHEPAPDSSIATEVKAVSDWADVRYARADRLAMRHQSAYRRLVEAVHFLAAFAVAAVAAEVVFAGRHTEWLGLEIFFLLLLILAVAIGRRGRVRERWMGYRSLAEAFRSGLFVALAGARDSEDAGPVGVGTSAEPWFQRAFSEAWRDRPRVNIDEAQAADLRELIVGDWIEDQIGFHSRRAAFHRRRRAEYTWIIYVLATVTIVVATLHIAHWPESSAWSDAFAFIAITLPGFGAAVTGLREGGQHRLHEERSVRTVARLKQLLAGPPGAVDVDTVRALVVETHRVIVEENVGWSGVMEFQELELVI